MQAMKLISQPFAQQHGQDNEKWRSFIHSRYLYSAPSRNLLRVALSPATAKEKCLEKLAVRRHNVPRQEGQCKREFIPSWGVNSHLNRIN